MNPIRKKILWITQTAAMLALLIALQWVGSHIPDMTVKQLITGSCVNAVLAVTVLVAGTGSGVTVALISPVCAFLFGISQPITVPVIMLGNLSYVLLLRVLITDSQKPVLRTLGGLVAAAVVKFGAMYALVAYVICGFAADFIKGVTLPGQTMPLLSEKMVIALPLSFGWTQLVAALIGGGLALAIIPTIRKAIKR